MSPIKGYSAWLCLFWCDESIISASCNQSVTQHFPTTHLLIALTPLNHSRAGTFPFPWRPLRAPAPMHDSHYCLWLTGHKFHKSFSPGLIGQTLNCYSLDAKILHDAVPLAPDWVHPASESPNWFIGVESQWSVLRSSRWKWSKSRGSAQR